MIRLSSRRWMRLDRSLQSRSSSSSSVCKDEVENFSKMSAQWWDYKRNPLITMNPIRMSYIFEILSSKTNSNSTSKETRIRPLDGLTALDVGCGGGLLSESLARLGASVTAIDPSSSLVEVAKQHLFSSQQQHCSTSTTPMQIDYRPGVSIEQLAMDMQGMPNDNLYDIICIMEVMEHTTNPQSILQAASSLLKKETNTTVATSSDRRTDSATAGAAGILFLSTINRTIKSYAIAIVGAEYISGQVPLGTHNWNQFYSPQEVEAMAKSAGLKLLDVRGMTIQPSSLLCGPMLWELSRKDLDVNWIASYTNASDEIPAL